MAAGSQQQTSSDDILNELFSTFNCSFEHPPSEPASNPGGGITQKSTKSSSISSSLLKKAKKKKKKQKHRPSSSSSSERKKKKKKSKNRDSGVATDGLSGSPHTSSWSDPKKVKKKKKSSVASVVRALKTKSKNDELVKRKKKKRKLGSITSGSTSTRVPIGDGFVVLKKSNTPWNPGTSSTKELEDGEIVEDDETKRRGRKSKPSSSGRKTSCEYDSGGGGGTVPSKKLKLSASQAYQLDAEEKLLLGYGGGNDEFRTSHDSIGRSSGSAGSSSKYRSSKSSSRNRSQSPPNSNRHYLLSDRSPPSSSSPSSQQSPRVAPPRDSYRSSYMKFEKERRDSYESSSSNSLSSSCSAARYHDSASYYDYHAERSRTYSSSGGSSSRSGFGYVGKSYYYDDVEDQDSSSRSSRDHTHHHNNNSSGDRDRPYGTSAWRHRERSPPSRRSGRSYYHPDDIIDKAELLEIARKNAKKLLQRGVIPTDIFSRDQILAIKAGGKSVDELTHYCKRLARKDAAGDATDVEDDDESGSRRRRRRRGSGSDDDDNDDEVGGRTIHHPFQVKEKPLPTITLNIRNAVPLPVRTPQELAIESAKLRTQFPVSSGTQHRFKELEWKPVDQDTSNPPEKKEGQSSTAVVPLLLPSSSSSATGPNVATVAPMVKEPESSPLDDETPNPDDNSTGQLKAIESGCSSPHQPASTSKQAQQHRNSDDDDGISVDGPGLPLVDISSVIGLRLKAMRSLQENPDSDDARKQLDEATKMMKNWADAKAHEPKFLTPAELSSGPQAWAKRDQLRKTRALDSGMGMHLLQKMGWRPGEGLGKNKEGQLEPLALDVKTDKKGLSAAIEDLLYGGKGSCGTSKPSSSGSGPSMPVVYDLSGKHPVSALMELTAKRRWGAPEFELCFEHGPPHKRQFVYKVIVNGVEYQPCVAVGNKKQAKANAAAFCLQSLGLLPTVMMSGGEPAEMLQTVPNSDKLESPGNHGPENVISGSTTGAPPVPGASLQNTFSHTPTFLQTVKVGPMVVTSTAAVAPQHQTNPMSLTTTASASELMPPPPPPPPLFS